MLEIRHLTKIYRAKKGGTDTHALDDVSLRFPETGMVFLLGRSGSGKSTLLNVCGGLDAPTSGEVIVKGRSSKDFTQSDFDSYRNTFIGFIFQEYNILNEFTVEDNIALAPELQGKPKDKAAIEELLKQVDLVGFAKRKPNTLSGGQKQRIAIARALIKQPEIIMADEPTGALDSTTGKQVFDTLKKLSKTKLVIVVSHDRGFAEEYGDRIIELKDGKVISDVTKETRVDEANGNVIRSGDSLCIKNSEKLTEDDLLEIRKFLQNAHGSVMLASGEKDVAAVKKATGFSERGRDFFNETKEDAIPRKAYTKEDSRFIRSRLPLRHAARIGISGVKSKPVRLIFTILLSTIAFIMFGLLSTMMLYNDEAAYRQSLQDSTYKTLYLAKRYATINDYYDNEGEIAYSYTRYSETPFTPAELTDYEKKFGKSVVPVVSTRESRIQNALEDGNYLSYYQTVFHHISTLKESHPLRNSLQGNYPKNGEVAISSYLAESLVHNGIYSINEFGDKETVTLNSTSDLIGKTIYFYDRTGMNEYKISAIVPVEIPSVFDALKDPSDDSYSLFFSLQSEIAKGLAGVIWLSEEDFSSLASQNKAQERTYEYLNYFGPKRNISAIVGHDLTSDSEYSYSQERMRFYYSDLASNDRYEISFFDPEKTTLADNEVVVESYTLLQAIYAYDSYCYMNNLPVDPSYQEDLENITINGEKISIYQLLYCFTEGRPAFDANGMTQEQASQLSALHIQNFFGKYADLLDLKTTISFAEENQEYKIVGFFPFNEMRYSYEDSGAFFSTATAKALDDYREQGIKHVNEMVSYTNYVVPSDAIYSALIIPYDHSALTTEIILSLEKLQDDHSSVVVDNELRNTFESINSVVNELKTIFFWIGFVLAVFSALLLSNFISVSISYKKKDIGILRAVGARGADVFRIFFCESGFLSGICVLLSGIFTVIVCIVINANLPAVFGGVSLFVFGPLNLLLIIAVALLTTVVATFLPVYHAAKKKPVDSIRSL